MAFSVFPKYWLLVCALFCISFCHSNFGEANDAPRVGARNEYLAQQKLEGETDGYYPQGGTVGSTSPDLIFKEAEKCFNAENIYSSCDEAYRLTESGELNVPRGYTEQYCGGPCLSETQRVLECIAGVSEHFLFYNRATLGDIGNTIEHGCGYGPRRGNFDVAARLEGGYASEMKMFNPVLMMLMIVGWFMSAFLI